MSYSARRIALYTESQCDRDFLQCASGRHGGRLKPLDHPLDFGQAPLDVKELAPDAVQFLREDLVLAALVVLAHDASGL